MVDPTKEMTGALLGPVALQQVREVTRRVLGEFWNAPTPRGRDKRDGQRRSAVTLENIDAATDRATAPGTGTVLLLGVDPATRELISAETTVEVVNRFLRIDVPADTLCHVEYIDGEWRMYAADCPISVVDPGWQASATSTYVSELDAIYEQVTGLSITIPQNEAAGKPFQYQIQLRVTNTGNQSGALETNIGLNGAAPTEAPIDSRPIPPNSDQFLTLGATSISSQAYTAGDTLDVWCRETIGGGQVKVTLSGDLEEHTFIVVRPDL